MKKILILLVCVLLAPMIIRGQMVINSFDTAPADTNYWKWHESVNEGTVQAFDAAKHVLEDYFIQTRKIDFEQLLNEITKLSWYKHDKETNKFFFLYDLVGKIHQAQDIRLFRSYVPDTFPVYLHKDYLEILFSSNYFVSTR